MSEADHNIMTLVLPPALDEWLQAEADKLFLDKNSYARMLLGQVMRGTVTTKEVMPPASPQGRAPAYETRPGADGGERWAEQFLDEPRAEEIDVPADADGGEPSAELMALMAETSQLMGQLEAEQQNGAYRRPRPASLQAQPGGYDAHGRRIPPGGITRPAGVNPMTGQGDVMGDAHGNIVRRNFKHLGFRPGSV